MAKRIFTKIAHPELSVVNNETGEIVSGVADIKCTHIDEYIMCFLSTIPDVVMLDGNTIRVLMWCWKYSSFSSGDEANVINTNKAFKEKIRQNGCKLSDSAIDKAIHNLHESGMLIRQCKGSYYLNPNYFFKGAISDRSKLLCNISYKGREEQTADI